MYLAKLKRGLQKQIVNRNSTIILTVNFLTINYFGRADDISLFRAVSAVGP